MSAFSPASLQHLRNQIGQEVTYAGKTYIFVDILMDEWSVVLRAGVCDTMQTNLYGNAIRRVADIVTLPIYSSSGDSLNPELRSLGLLENDQIL